MHKIISINNPYIWIAIVLCCTAIVFFSCATEQKATERNRQSVENEASTIAAKLQADPDNQTLRFILAQRLFEIGNFQQSEETLQPLLEEKPSVEVLWLSANLEFLAGHYSTAEDQLFRIKEHKKATSEQKVQADIGLCFVYYQTGEYFKSHKILIGLDGKIEMPLWDLMKSFGEDRPYQIEWSPDSYTEIPFLLNDPLPVISVEINGTPIYVIIDTGADSFYLDEKLTGSLGIEPVTQITSDVFAGGKESTIGFARIDSLKIGNVILHSVPIRTGQISRFTEMVSNDDFPISGVLSTGDLRQFLSTIDYPNRKLVLRPKTRQARSQLDKENESRNVNEIPFWLAQTHLMIVNGAVNGHENMNFFTDSGLAHNEAGLLFHKQTLEYLGIPLHVMEKTSENDGGPGGGGFGVGSFSVPSFEIDGLIQKDAAGLVGVMPDSLYWLCDFIIDGIVSHRFLQKYSWTIDFDARTMIFAE